MHEDTEMGSSLLNRKNAAISPLVVIVSTSLTGNSISTNKKCEVLLATALVDS